MNKLILSLTALLIGLSALVFSLKHNTATLGSGSALKQVDVVASTTQRYYGAATAVDSRATTTVLTLNNIHQYDRVALKIEIFASTTATNQGFTYLQPQVSNDAITWADWIPEQMGTTGTIGTTIVLPAGTSTTITVPAGGLGTTTRQLDLGHVVGQYMRVLLGSTGTSSIRVYGVLQL